jgi:hypothetical protein
MIHDPRIQNQQGALELGSQSGPSSRRRPHLLNPKAEPIAPLRPGTPMHFRIPGATSPQGLSPWR